MELTYNQIIKVLNDFATNHYQINEFGNGDLWEVVEHNQEKDFNYPLLWVQDQPNTLTKNEIEMTFRCFFINLVQKDESNENEVKSDMHQCCIDLLSFWKKQVDYRLVSVDVNTTLTSFTERFNDELTGWWIDIKLTQQFRYDKCSIPMDGITPIPTNCLPATITINGESFTTAASGAIENIIVKDTNGTQVGSKVGNEWIVPVGGGDVTVENSDQSYQVMVSAGDTLVLPDITHTDSDGSPVTLPAQTPFVATACPTPDPAANQVNGDSKTDIPSGGSKNFIIRDQDSNPVTVTEVSDNATEFVGEVTIPSTPLNTANLFKTGQTTSYRTGDDGDREEGRGVDFDTLDFNNPFGNTNRFTDTAGGQNYDGTGGSENNVIVDWAYHDQVNGTVQMWYNVVTATSNWNTAIDDSLSLTVGIWSDWYLPNLMEMLSITWYEVSGGQLILLNYTPFNINITGTGSRMWTSTRGETTGRYFNLAENGIPLFSPSSSSLSYMPTTRIPVTDLIP